MTSFLAAKQKEFSLNFINAQQKFHNTDWRESCSDILFNYGNVCLKSFDFYIVSPFGNILDELDISNFLQRIYQDLIDILANIIYAIFSPIKAVGVLLMGDLNACGASLYQTIQSIEKIILNTIDIALNILLFVLSPFARIIATPIWYAMSPEI